MIIFNLYLDSFSGIQEKDSYLDALNLENKLLKEENARLRMKIEALKALKPGIHTYIPCIYNWDVLLLLPQCLIQYENASLIIDPKITRSTTETTTSTTTTSTTTTSTSTTITTSTTSTSTTATSSSTTTTSKGKDVRWQSILYFDVFIH